MIRPSILGLFLSCVALPIALNAQSLASLKGEKAIEQKGLELSSTLNVMMISLQPGFEDLAALGYFKLGKGARVMSAYLTNGEAGNSDLRYEYPNYLAATRRAEAHEALKILGVEHNFLAFVDIPAVQDSARLEELWPSDTLRMKLARLISGFRPDLLILSGDYELGVRSLRWRTLKRALLEAVSLLEPPKPQSAATAPIPQFPYWSVGRVVSHEEKSRGLKIPVEGKNPRLNRTYGEIAAEAAERYRSLSMQRGMWTLDSPRSYTVIYPRKAPTLTAIDQGLSPKLSKEYEALASRVHTLASSVQRLSRGRILSKVDRTQMLKNVVALIDEVDLGLANVHLLSAPERKTILDWKGDLEALRAALLGVSVHFSVTERVLTNVQLTYLNIDSVSGLSRNGTTEILFPGVDDGWIVNEWTEKRLPLQVGTPYRILSPKSVIYNYPDHQFGTDNPSLENPFLFFVIHRSAARESTFVHRSVVDIEFAPRFNVEVLKPIVFAVDSEQVPVRITNNSRDGVFDEYGVDESFVSSNKVPFRLSNKGDTRLDTLFLTWKELPEEGSHIVPIKIRDESIGGFVVRRFDVAADRTKSVGLITAYEKGPTEETLRRLKMPVRRLSLGEEDLRRASTLDVLILDHRMLSFRQISPVQQRLLREAVGKGVHLIVLTQDAPVWNRSPLIEGTTLTRVEDDDERVTVTFEADHPFMAAPNKLKEEDWSNWIYERTLNRAETRGLANRLIIAARSSSGNPYILSENLGSGKITYVNLSLHHQFINIHDGAMRVLANLISN